MSILDRIKEAQQEQGIFCFVAGLRFGGKTTSLGTLPGKTLLLEVGAKESGSLGARNMAKKLGNTMDVISVADCADALTLVREALELDYTNIAIDGLSALSVVESEKPNVAKLLKSTGNQVFGGWRILGETLTDTLQELKSISSKSGMNIVITIALAEEVEGDGARSTKMELKGRMTEGFIKGMCPYYVIARQGSDADGKPVRVIQTYDDGLFSARLDGIFDSDNPKGFRSDPDKVEEGGKVGLDAVFTFINNSKQVSN